MENHDSKSFINHVFNFEEHSKNEMLNIFQYALLAIIPIVLLNKTIQYLAPLPDTNKGSIEITIEIVLQIFVIFILLLITHRIITFVPTYSGMNYKEINIIQIILIALVFLLSFHTILSEKVNILVTRFIKYWDNGSTSMKNKENMSNDSSSKKNKTNTQSSISSMEQYLQPVQMPPSIPMGINTESFTPRDSEMQRDNMQMMEPMAANSVLGGSNFGSSNW